ncbi:MAG: hypothetical protein E7670_04760 [Ruminococcaceae bacterium]|nr:hypothetical protein [Oscillospiraceae bacterium]
MAKFRYFESLEELSNSALQAVQLSCKSKGCTKKEKEELSSIRLSADKCVCELEDALFADFLPPLERDSIAACAHCLSRVIDRAADLASSIVYIPTNSHYDEEPKICIRLCETLHADIALLKKIRKPSEMPSHRAFRALLAKGRNAHTKALAKISSGVLPRSTANSIILCAKLRSELARSYDELLEIMLNNI